MDTVNRDPKPSGAVTQEQKMSQSKRRDSMNITHKTPRSWDLCKCCGKWATDCKCHVVAHECQKVEQNISSTNRGIEGE